MVVCSIQDGKSSFVAEILFIEKEIGLLLCVSNT